MYNPACMGSSVLCILGPLSAGTNFACDSDGNKLNIIFVWLTSADDLFCRVLLITKRTFTLKMMLKRFWSMQD